jgi:hypothetical protein
MYHYSDIIFDRSNRLYHRPDQQGTWTIRRTSRPDQFVRVNDAARLNITDFHDFSASLLQQNAVLNENNFE